MALPAEQNANAAPAPAAIAPATPPDVPLIMPPPSGPARVTPAYPTDAVVQRLRGTRFGSHRLCSFELDGVTIEADDCKPPRRP